MANTPPPAPDGTLTDPNDIARLREAIAALQGGERARAREMFADLVQRVYRDVNVWLGLAMSSDEPNEAFGALRNARLIQPDNPFVASATADLSRRWPEEAARQELTLPPDLPALIPVGHPAPPPPPTTDEPAPPGEGDETAGGARLASSTRRAVATTPARQEAGRGWRAVTLLAVGAGFLALMAVLILGVQNTGILRPAQPTAPATAVPPLPTPRVRVPPTVPPRGALPAGSPVTLPTLTASSTLAARQRAIQAVQEGRFAQAVPLLEQATARDPQDAEALYYLGLAYLNAPGGVHSLSDALLSFRSVTALRPDWPPGLQMQAEALMRQRPPQYRDAVPLAHRAAELDPARPEYWITLARAYAGAGDNANATVAYNEAARHSPAPPPRLPTVAPSATPAPPTPTAVPTVPPPPPTSAPGPVATPTTGETPTVSANSAAAPQRDLTLYRCEPGSERRGPRPRMRG